MTENKKWLVNLNSSKKTSVKIANSSYLAAKGISDILIKKKDGASALIEKLLYVPGIKCNLLSIDQLVEKVFKVPINGDVLQLFDKGIS